MVIALDWEFCIFIVSVKVSPDALTLLEVGDPVTDNEVGSTKTIVESPETPPDWPKHVYVLAVPAVNVNVFEVGDVAVDQQLRHDGVNI